MVKVFYLGLFAAIICAFAVSYASAGPVPTNLRQHPLLQHQFCNGSHCQPQQQQQHQQQQQQRFGRQHQEAAYAEDGTVRSERSTNLSHITGSARKIQMFVKNWHLQILPDGVVNGTQDDSSDYTILQRISVNNRHLKIQGVATCQYLCMDSCGLLYASAIISHRVNPLPNTSNIHGHRIRINMKNLKWTTEKDFVDECIFNEMIEQHHYNTYSSVSYSNARKTLYIALNRWGQPRRVQIRAKQQLGKLSTYARVLTKTVSLERVEDLLTRIGNSTNAHPLRHHGGLQTCTSVIEQKSHSSDSQGVDRLRCRKRKKRKKKRRRCDKQDGGNSEGCPINNNKKKNNNGGIAKKNIKNVKNSDKNKQCEHDSNSKKCQRLGGKSDLVTVKKRKKQKQLNANRNPNIAKKKNNQKTLKNNSNRKIVKKVLAVFQEDDNTTISSASVEETSIAEETSMVEESSVPEESSIMDESTTMTSAMEDSEQNYDDNGSVVSSTQPSAEVD